MPKVNERDIFEIKEWLNDTPQNVEEYEEMVGGATPTGTIEISANGEYDVSEYATADVQVEGGGSSDFSTAEVTIINQATMSLSNVPATVCYEENDLGGGVPATLFPSIISIPSSQTGSIKCALYKGTSAIMFADYTEFVEISVSGDATYMGGMVAVTGDCTITITEKQ